MVDRMKLLLQKIIAVRIFALLLAVPIGLAGVTEFGGAAAQALQQLSFSHIVVKGNLRIETATIRNFAAVKTGTPVTPGQINAAHQRIMATGLFEKVTITPKGGALVISVQEFPTINRINFERNKKIKDADLAKLITSRTRHTYSPAQAEADVNLILEAYRQAGRYSAKVTPKIIRRADNRVDLVFEVFEGKTIEIQRLSILGNRSFSDRRLRRILATKQAGLFHQLVKADTFVADRLEFDKQVLRDFYLSRGFIDFQILSANVEVVKGRNGFFVTFKVREGQSYKFGALTTTSQLADVDPDAFQAVVGLKSGTTYSPLLVDRTVGRMETLATNKGLNFIRVTPRVTRNDANRTLDIAFTVERGPRIFVERIDIEGNTTTLDRVIRRQFDTVEGDPFNPRRIRKAASRIKALGFFSKADVTTREGSSPDRMIVDVNVKEQPTGSFVFGIAYGGSGGVTGTVSLSEKNFLGRGQFLKAALGGGPSNRDIALTFAEPQFLDRDLRAGIDIFRQTTTRQNAGYDTALLGISPSLAFPISENGRLSLKYRWSSDTLTNIGPNGFVKIVPTPTLPAPSTASQPGAQTSRLITGDPAAGGSHSISSFGATYTFDNRKSGINPKAGLLFRVSEEIAGVGGTAKFSKTTALAGVRTTMFRDQVDLSAEFEGGALISTSAGGSSILDRFFMGQNVMRGYALNGIGPRDRVAANQDALGGNYYAVARFEANFPLGLPEEYGVAGGVFMDVGSLWGLNKTAGGSVADSTGTLTGTATVDASMKLRQVVGLSLFWKTAIGPLRFNFTHVISGQAYDQPQGFSLTIGKRF